MNNDILPNNKDKVTVEIINNRVFLRCDVVKTTGTGMQVRHAGGETWFPLSQVQTRANGIIIKPWLAENRGYVRHQPRNLWPFKSYQQHRPDLGLVMPDQVADSMESFRNEGCY